MSRIKDLENALKVLVLTPAIRDWLKANDPKALEQAEKALSLKEYTVWILDENQNMVKVGTYRDLIKAMIEMNFHNQYVEIRSDSGQIVDWLEAW